MTLKQLQAAAFLAIGLMAGAATVASADDRPPTPEERAAIEDALRQAGFLTWEEIELDDDVWEVDDAQGDGGKFDLKLDPETLGILSSDRED